MSQYRLTAEAKADLDEVWNYTTRNWGEDQAEAYLKGLDLALEKLAEGNQPSFSCQAIVPEATSAVRCFQYRSHYIFFRQHDQSIDVLTVIHTASQGAIEGFLSDGD